MRQWISIHVELIGGGGHTYWPRPGRVIAASPTHTLRDLATAIDTAFARWDRNHLHEFVLPDHTRAGIPDPDDPSLTDSRHVRLSALPAGAEFAYVFDLGDYWAHHRTITADTINPTTTFDTTPAVPTPHWGWGTIPDQYGRAAFHDDDGPDPNMTDLPPLLPAWGP